MARPAGTEAFVHRVLLGASKLGSECMMLLQDEEAPAALSGQVASWPEANANLASMLYLALVFRELRRRHLASLVEEVISRYTAFIGQFEPDPSAYMATILEGIQEFEALLPSLDEKSCESCVRCEFHLLAETVRGPMMAFYSPNKDDELASIVLAQAYVIRDLLDEFATN